MVDPNKYIKEGLKIVKTLVKQNNLASALFTARELLRLNPYASNVQKEIENIEKIISKKNIEKVDADIDATMSLWKEKRFDDLLKIYSQLYKYAPNYARLRKLIAKITDQLSSDQKKQREDFMTAARNAIEGLFKEGRFEEALQASNELTAINPLDENAQSLLKRAKQNLAEQKLKQNERIADSADFQRSLDFYESLLEIDPENTVIKNLALQAKEHLAHQKMVADKIHLNESVVRMKELFAKSEFEKVIQACEEIERLDPGNFSAKVFRKKAQDTLTREAAEQIIKKMMEASAAMKSDYEKNPGNFVRV